MRLMDALRSIEKEALISFHMPGHKNGRLLFENEKNILSYDITEIPGADHLHDSEDCILETEQTLAKMYNALRSRILVGGSTVGIISMILGMTNPGERVLLNRNAHKSVYNAIEMNGLIPVYIYPEIDNYLGIPTGFDNAHFDALIEDVKICILTYPTYEGLCFPIEEMIAKCHERKIPVLVDEAHGAHLFLHENGCRSALALGADIVVQSFHKTLPAMTQTACLHISKLNCLTEGQINKVDWYLKSLQSSSPSYILMASVDQMITIIESVGRKYTDVLERSIKQFYNDILHLKHIEAIKLSAMDITKIILAIPPTSYIEGIWDGTTLSSKLRNEYGIQCEYDSKTMILLMTSFCNKPEDFNALRDALYALDYHRDTLIENLVKNTGRNQNCDYQMIYRAMASERIFVMCAAEATKLEWEVQSIMDSIGRISAEYVIPYPPGIPILVPGERILEGTLALFPKSKQKIKIIKEENVI